MEKITFTSKIVINGKTHKGPDIVAETLKEAQEIMNKEYGGMYKINGLESKEELDLEKIVEMVPPCFSLHRVEGDFIINSAFVPTEKQTLLIRALIASIKEG